MYPTELLKRERLTELTETLVGINSITSNEKEISDWVYNYLVDLGLTDVQKLHVEEAGDTIAGYIEGSNEGPTLMLNFHLDTFDAFKDWKTDPLTPTKIGDRLYGLGSHDMKGGAACLLGAIEAIIESEVELRGRVLVTATSDEEYWSRGAHELIKQGYLKDCDYCMVPEPAALGTLTIGQRGRHVFTLRVHGKTVSAAYNSGVNDVVDAARVVSRLGDITPEQLGYLPKYDMQGSLCVIGFQGGSNRILVPELAEVLIDRHILPGESVDDAADQIREIINSSNIESSYELTWDERPTPAPTSFIVPPESRFVQIVKSNLEDAIGRKVQLTLGRSVADTNHFAVHGDVPTIICGPSGGNTCEANEWVDLDSLVPIAITYVRSMVDLLGVRE